MTLVFSGNSGDTFLTATPGNPIKHLWILIELISQDKGIFANLTDAENSDDNSAILVPGDHPFVIIKSAVFFKYAREMSISGVRELIQKGVAFPHEPISDAILKRIAEGLRKSEYTPRGILESIKGKGPGGDSNVR